MVEGRNKGGLMKSPYLDNKTIMGVLEGFCQNKARIFLFFNIKKRKRKRNYFTFLSDL
jgi:hypothetical protein